MMINIESVLAQILTNQLRRIEYSRNGALNVSNLEHIHDLRVSIRRARFALRLFAPFVDSDKCYEIRKSLGTLNSRLGKARDLDISIARLKKLSAKHRLNPSVEKKLFYELSRRRKTAQKGMLKALGSARYRDTIFSILKFIKELNGMKLERCKDKNTSKIINKLTKKHVDKLLKWGNRNFKKLSSKDLHKMRIDFKRARYLMEFFLMCSEAQKDIKRDITVFTSFQDILGRHQDALTVIRNVKKASENIGIGKKDVAGVIKSENRRAKKSRVEFADKWQKFRNKPKYNS